MLELDELGFDHHFTAGQVLARWGIPEPVVLAVRHAGDPDYRGSYARLVSLTRLAWSWSQEGFPPLSSQGLLRGLNAQQLASLHRECTREAEQLESFAGVLAMA